MSLSPSVQDLECPIFPRCSGCKTLTGLKKPAIWQEVESFFSSQLSFSPELVSKEIIAWRYRVKLAVRGTSRKPLIGLFEAGSHKVVSMQGCPMHVKELDVALKSLYGAIERHEIEPYRENDHSGRLKYIQMHLSQKTCKIQLSLIFCGSSLTSKEKEFVKQLYKLGVFQSIWACYQPEKTNTILGQSWEVLAGDEVFYQRIQGIDFAFHPSCFSQAHLTLFEDMVSYIKTLVAPDVRLLELYSGVGCMGVLLAPYVSKVTMVESSLYSKWSFEKTLKKLPKSFESKLIFRLGSVENEAFNLNDVDLILVDPPRKGLSKPCKGKIYRSSARELIYVSCGFEAFQRDALEIVDQGWKLINAKGFVLFPGTNHVEIVAHFVKLGV